MKHKVSELEGALLDAAVAKAEGLPVEADAKNPLPVVQRGTGNRFIGDPMGSASPWRPSTDWQDGGPIIQRERIDMTAYATNWHAQLRHLTNDASYGATPLIAAMRAYVASRLGDEVELP